MTSAMPVLCDAIAAKGLDDLVVAPGEGFAKRHECGPTGCMYPRHCGQAPGAPLRIHRNGGADRLGRWPDMADSAETQPTAPSSKVELVSVAPLFGDAIRRPARHESISALFDQ